MSETCDHKFVWVVKDNGFYEYRRVPPDGLPRLFWVVWNPSGQIPTKKHYSFDEASKEAKRLAVRHPGKRFYVLKSVEEVKAQVDVTAMPMVCI